MERPIGDIFDYDGITIKVVKSNRGCAFCDFFNSFVDLYNCWDHKGLLGGCLNRHDSNKIVFKVVKTFKFLK